MLVDSHCHIVFRNFDDDLEEVSRRWRDAGVKALVHACVEPGEIGAIRALADRFPELRYSVGVHPLDTQHWHHDTAAVLRQAARSDSRVVAIGELGLHCRDAAEPMLNLLRQRADRGACPRGVMHCWGGSPEEMAAFLELGFLISFSGTVTFPKAAATHACAQLVPADRYLIETDCPFLAPVPRRGKRNEPAFVASVAARMAELRGETLTEVALTSSSNAAGLFGLTLHTV